MSFWSFLGGFAIFKLIWSMFSCKSNHVNNHQPQYDYIPASGYKAHTEDVLHDHTNHVVDRSYIDDIDDTYEEEDDMDDFDYFMDDIDIDDDVDW